MAKISRDTTNEHLELDGIEGRFGTLDGYTVGRVVNLCMGATLPRARRRGLWEALVAARVATFPDRPPVAVTRFTMWHRPAAARRS